MKFTDIQFVYVAYTKNKTHIWGVVHSIGTNDFFEFNIYSNKKRSMTFTKMIDAFYEYPRETKYADFKHTLDNKPLPDGKLYSPTSKLISVLINKKYDEYILMQFPSKNFNYLYIQPNPTVIPIGIEVTVDKLIIDKEKFVETYFLTILAS